MKMDVFVILNVFKDSLKYVVSNWGFQTDFENLLQNQT